jgi:hypothetical protein
MARWPLQDGQSKLTPDRRFVAENDWFVGRLKTDARTDNGTVLRCGIRLARRPKMDALS